MQQWWRLLDDIQAESPRPALGVRIGQHVRPYHSGPLGYLIMSSETLGDALLRFARYQSLLHNFSDVDLTARGNEVIISWSPDQGLSTQLSDEVYLSSLVVFVRQITGQPTLSPSRICFNHPAPSPVRVYEELLGCPVRFECERVSLAMPATALRLQVNTRDPYLLTLLEKQAEAMRRQPTTDQDEFLSQLRQTISNLLPQGDATLTQSARKMHVSTRTLHRRLAERGTQFQAVLREVRQEMARMYLADPALSLQEIALLLGYAEQSVFSRACRQWFGMSAREWRRSGGHPS